jgi:hypothetical protein
MLFSQAPWEKQPVHQHLSLVAKISKNNDHDDQLAFSTTDKGKSTPNPTMDPQNT